MTASKKLDRFIKDKSGVKVSMSTTSVNLESRHMEFLKRRNLNLSAMVRELLDSLITDESDDSSEL